MVWDATQPTNTTKIRNLGVVIRPNWDAIQLGDPTLLPQSINFANRTPLPAVNDPAAIANSYILYCKEDASGNPQLFGIDQASRISQFTTSVTPTSAASGFTFLPGGMVIQWKHTGNIGSNADSVQTFPVAFSADPYSIVITGRHNGGEVVSGNIHTLTPANFTLRNTSAHSRDFYWIAIGPKV